MTGFKSFPEKTVMHMNGSITGVVGPNGSGKSNVSDAVRWVLGEQSPKTLRGSVMQDVIFAGTQARKPRSFCEVSLLFDNSDNRVSMGFSEIQITRKLYSSGEGEYFINGSKCRLKDILAMFRDTGIGKEGYSIIGQGRIDEILSERSLDRRRVFEEASGIMKYRVRKEEAERKLEKTRFNLIRIEDILQEQRLRLEPLKVQAEEAMEYLKLSGRLKHLEINLFLHSCDSGRERIEKLKQAKQALADEKIQKKDMLSELDSLLHTEQESSKDLERTGAELASKLSVSLAEIERVEGEINLCCERIANLEKDSLRIGIEIEEADGKASELKESGKNNASRIEAIESELEALHRSADEIQKALLNLTGDFEDRAKIIEAAQNARLEATQKMGDLKSTASALGERETFIRQSIEEIDGRIEAAAQQRLRYEEQQRSMSGGLELSAKRSADIRSEYNESVQQKAALSIEIDGLKQTLESLRRERAACESAVALLSDMKNSYEGYTGSVRKLMTAVREGGASKADVRGTVADLISVSQKYEIAIESCLGAALQNVVVGDEYDAKELISYLRKNDMGRVTFLPLGALQPKSLAPEEKKALVDKGAVGLASELVSCDISVRTAAEFLLGRTIIAEDSDAAIRIMREFGYSFRTVTLQGDIFNPGGAITGGSVRRESSGLISRDRKEEELKKRGQELAQKISSLESQIVLKQDEHDSLLDAIEASRMKLHSNEIDISAAKEKLEALTIAIEDAEKTAEELKAHSAQLSGELAAVREEIEKYNALCSDMQHTNDTQSEGYKHLEEDYNRSAAQIEQSKRALHDTEIKIAEYHKEKVSIESDNQRIEKELGELEKARAMKSKMLALNAESEDNLKKLKEELEALRVQKNAVTDDIKKRQSEIARKRSELGKTLSDRDEKLLALRQELGDISEKSMRLDFNIEKADTAIQEAHNKLWDAYRLTYANALPEREKINVSEAQSEAEDIKQKIRDIGNVNANAIEDYSELKERMESLASQKDDLITAEEDLHKLIASLVNEMRKTFRTSFDMINRYFNQTFQELFNGGSARLVLEDDEDIMECGIEIVAEPPGKKLQKISLLSGGEKALTAISLLFALLKINPSPVCILDEIDAALDDSNVYKFSEYLKKYAQDMQFIVITHRKPTMIVCDSLYGFAMEEKGVSKLLSVKMD